ncbi:CUB-like domain-containing protein [Caenorhabditis elegans]|nr:CUB-like domain-containing protein [Caenorhabditis elegans]CBL43445.1 CUB-like domain-containing protein [Caenorhabditis elegans]|eukprot:NP_001255690.1 Downstream Of DAF-16 (regulated by DAF-16) [Caenorhabditis elegans]
MKFAPPKLDKGQTCSWTVTVPDGFYAKLVISAKAMDRDTYFQTIDSAGNLAKTGNEKMKPYYFVGPKFTIALSSNAPAAFGFKIIWLPFPNIDIGYSGVTEAAEVLNATGIIYKQSIYSRGGIHLLPFPQDPTNYFSLRSALVFEGGSFPGCNYVGNLYQMYRSKKPYSFSSEGSIVVFNLAASGNSDKLLIQDTEYVQDIAQFVELYPEIKTSYTETINGGKLKSSLVSVSGANFKLTKVKMDDEATMAVYYGSPTVGTIVKNYTALEINKAVPLNFQGEVLQFVVSSGKADFTFDGWK